MELVIARIGLVCAQAVSYTHLSAFRARPGLGHRGAGVGPSGGRGWPGAAYSARKRIAIVVTHFGVMQLRRPVIKKDKAS